MSNLSPRPSSTGPVPRSITTVWPSGVGDIPDPLATAYRVPRPRPSDRPWVALTMISSIDGAIEIDGNSKGLGNANDSLVFATMRFVSDVVIVGSATVAADGYGPPSKPGQRIGVVSRSIDVDLTTPLFTSGAGFLITTDEAVVPHGGDAIDVVRCGRDTIDFGVALHEIDRLVSDVNVVHLEGGPTLNGLLIDAGLVDEINLTTAPLIVGGPSPRVISTGHQIGRRFALAHQLIDDDGYVFSRWIDRRYLAAD